MMRLAYHYHAEALGNLHRPVKSGVRYCMLSFKWIGCHRVSNQAQFPPRISCILRKVPNFVKDAITEIELDLSQHLFGFSSFRVQVLLISIFPFPMIYFLSFLCCTSCRFRV